MSSTSIPGKSRGNSNWQDVNQAILDALDIEAEYVAMGVKFGTRKVSDKGWLECHAIDHPESTSAAVHVGKGPQRGRYRDLGGNGLSLSMYDFAARFGGRGDWREAREYYAGKARVRLPAGPEPANPGDSLEFKQWNDLIVGNWCQLKGGVITVEAVKSAGGQLARWPMKAPDNRSIYVIAFPIFSAAMLDADPSGWVLVNQIGKDVPVWQGKGKTPAKRKTHTVGGSHSGMMNAFAMAQLATAELVWKVEGVSDMLVLQSKIPPERRAKEIVITNSGGSQENCKPEWRKLFAGKKVFVVHDADEPGQSGAVKWCAALGKVAAEVRNVQLPYPISKDRGKDLRDWFMEDQSRTYDSLLALATQAEPLKIFVPDREPGEKPDGSNPAAAAGYVVDNGRICRCKFNTNGTETLEPLCNFTATITKEIVHDDGSEELKTFLGISGTLSDGTALPSVEVSSTAFPGMAWVLEKWGMRAVVFAGQGAKDHLRAAIQLLFDGATKEVVYEHTGWREIKGQWIYLHRGGAIGPIGPIQGTLESLPAALEPMRLPDPPEGEELVKCIRASLKILDLAPPRVTVPTLGCVHRAPLGHSDLGVHLVGRTGTFKTELATICQQHFGAGFDSRSLPGNWSSTANANEGLAFAAKDMVLVIDDFAPGGTSADISRAHGVTDRIFRNVGNQQARHRMNPDGSLRAPKPPRALILSTGEEIPRGHSIRARLVIVEVGKNEIVQDTLTECQTDGAAGLYAGATAGYIRWLAGRYDDVQKELRSRLKSLQQVQRANEPHARTTSNLIQLRLGWEWFLAFAEVSGAIDAAEKAAILAKVHGGLSENSEAQFDHQQDAEPTQQFLRLLSACVASGRAHVASMAGREPSESPQSWGWRERSIISVNISHGGWDPQGRRVGWLDGDNLYLEPEVAHAEAQRLAFDKGESLPISVYTLSKRLHERNLLITTETARGKLTVRRTIQGTDRCNVWHLNPQALSSPPAIGPIGPICQPEAQVDASKPITVADCRADSAHHTKDRPTESAHKHGKNGSVGRLGRLGRLKEGVERPGEKVVDEEGF